MEISVYLGPHGSLEDEMEGSNSSNVLIYNFEVALPRSTIKSIKVKVKFVEPRVLHWNPSNFLHVSNRDISRYLTSS